MKINLPPGGGFGGGVVKLTTTPKDSLFLKKSPGHRRLSLCITLRQWAILCSILIFIFTAIFTTCSVLGTMHTRNMIDLLNNDIDQEHEKAQAREDEGFSANEAKLRISKSFLIDVRNFLVVLMWLGWINLILSAILIYGVITSVRICMAPWITIGGFTCLLFISMVIMGLFNLIPGFIVNENFLVVTFVFLMVFSQFWYTIVLYYINLSRTRCLRFVIPRPTIIQSHGGYQHTIQPLVDTKKKPLLV